MNAVNLKQNPYDWFWPVVESELFAGRKQELETIEKEIARLADARPIVPMIAVTGERRVGKTSLLRQAERICHKYRVLAVLISVTDITAGDPWYFWQEVFSQLLVGAQQAGISTGPATGKQFGFSIPTKERPAQADQPVMNDLWFPKAYGMHLAVASPPGLTNHILGHDLKIISDSLLTAGYQGVLLMLDEAHVLSNAQEIKQQIRYAVQEAGRCGLIFAGTSQLSVMFTESSEPFFGQVRVISLKNFTNPDDIAECALLPLSDDERRLVSPMTVDYLARLSQGKPNQIRLICQGIYSRYIKGEQDDLNITIDVLDDVLDILAAAFQDEKLRTRVDAIRRLNSVDLELLYNMTRYPNWSMRDIVDLDECFRGETKSDLAVARRERNLSQKRAYFISSGLMDEDSDRYILSGGEFLALYLRFWYEVRKYGELSRSVVLGKGPPTPFGEKVDKLARSLSYVLEESPEVGRFIFHSYDRGEVNTIETIKRRFLILGKLMKGEPPKGKDMPDLLSECFDVCQLISKAGLFYLLCLSVRNLENPRELVQVELYFDFAQMRTVDLLSLFNLVNQQAYDAKVLIEGYDGFRVELPGLADLLNAIGVPSLDDLLAKIGVVDRWRLASIQHLVQSGKVTKESRSPSDQDKDKDKDNDNEELGKWIALYAKGDEEGAQKYLIAKLQETQERHIQARLYNDLGYIRCGPKLKAGPLAKRNLETALNLHYLQLPLTLLNLSYVDIDEGEYEPAIKRIEEALLLTFGRLQIKASYLRLRLPENHLGFRERWEQHPANVIEAAYINLAYALLKSNSYQEALNILEEGLSVIPSSIGLKHALARLYLFNKRADLAKPVYGEISRKSPLDKSIELEIKVLSRGFRITKSKPRSKR